MPNLHKKAVSKILNLHKKAVWWSLIFHKKAETKALALILLLFWR